ncbi:molecular chaperone HtpG [Hoyosella subflava]|uniref:Chaperone protein HtpG n=1 Tax=Hoyosella subflava (strain DSM 45089 / JCM 17490 / NBRC 109087 / DQS3-9A1) TaxID=443218 RepID=F6EFP8_HOYSD|nr:molecular chaperone HtpG [Hoyosella subflava]AEF40977.1 Chaperone protein htpG [Hoyosella subflava DQS3-9A1]
MSTQVEERTFQAEARQLLELMIHSVYSNKDTFLRELISNASDALDKARIEAFRDKDLQIDTSDLHIEIAPDPDKRTLTVRDNGIGMSRDEVVELIGTLAKSGTGELRRALAEAKDAEAPADLIGQFGIGFYSTFMVADNVTMVTRRAGEDTATRWESQGTGTYTIETIDTAPQGTEITLHLKPEDSDHHLFDYTKEWKIREIVKRYSDFISWPIRMDIERTTDDETTIETVTLNSMKALWARPKDEVSADEYNEFYKHVSHAWDEPLETIAMRAEGTFEYQALLFIPSQAPFDLFTREHARGVQLYVKRVFIMDNCEELMPQYLRFVKGVVDAQDLSLNVSREILQQDRQIKRIQKRLVKKVLGAIKDLDADKYRTFWSQFGRVLKEGLLSDTENRETLLEIASFASTRTTSEESSEEQVTTLKAYVERMGEKQDAIYYMTGETRELIENSPHMEAFRAKGVEVLVLTDPVDEMWVDAVGEYDGKPLKSIAKGDVDLEDEPSEEDKSKQEERDKEFADVLDWLKTTLGDDIKDARLSSRLTTSPACLVGDTFDMTPTLEKLYRASGQPLPKVKRILELNPAHPLVTSLRDAHGERADDPALSQTAELLYGMAVLSEGGELRDPARFTRLLAERLTQHL